MWPRVLGAFNIIKGRLVHICPSCPLSSFFTLTHSNEYLRCVDYSFSGKKKKETLGCGARGASKDSEDNFQLGRAGQIRSQIGWFSSLFFSFFFWWNSLSSAKFHMAKPFSVCGGRRVVGGDIVLACMWMRRLSSFDWCPASLDCNGFHSPPVPFTAGALKSKLTQTDAQVESFFYEKNKIKWEIQARRHFSFFSESKLQKV